MKIEIVEKKENPLLKRFEIKFRVDHSNAPTPRRLEVRSKLAAQLGIAEELLVIEKLASTSGKQVASGLARAYRSKEELEKLEPKYLLERGMPKKEKPEAEKPPKEARQEKEKPVKGSEGGGES